MKKALVILVALALAAPLYASTITFEETSPGVIEWTSDVGCVAMGLDVNMTLPGEVTAVAVDSFFDIYMDVAFDEEDTGDGYTYGEDNGNGPVADQDAAGSIALPQSNFCISMGGLGGEVEPLDAAPTSGTITLEGSGDGEVTENSLRGGCIDENGDTMTAVGLPLAISIDGGEPDCMLEAGIDVSDPTLYAQYLEAGSPECWCYPRQCNGDADGKKIGSLFAGYTYVNTDDLNILSAGWLIKDPPKDTGILDITGPNGEPAACADFNRAKLGSLFAGYTRVNTDDLDIMSLYYLVKEPPKDTGTPAGCVPGNREPEL